MDTSLLKKYVLHKCCDLELQADSSNDRISLGLKESYFPETVSEVESESEQAAADMDEPEVIATDGAARNASIEEEDSEVEPEAEAGAKVDKGDIRAHPSPPVVVLFFSLFYTSSHSCLLSCGLPVRRHWPG